MLMLIPMLLLPLRPVGAERVGVRWGIRALSPRRFTHLILNPSPPSRAEKDFDLPAMMDGTSARCRPPLFLILSLSKDAGARLGRLPVPCGLSRLLRNR